MTPDNRQKKGPELGSAGAKGAGLLTVPRRTGAPPSALSGGVSKGENGGTDPQRARRLSDVPTKYRDLYRRAYAGKSRKAAIRAHCLECVYWSPKEVALCTAPACPLYEFRLKG